jgi:hypothetical protein
LTSDENFLLANKYAGTLNTFVVRACLNALFQIDDLHVSFPLKKIVRSKEIIVRSKH